MAVYNVSYDLRKAGQDYTGLTEELKRSPAWWHYLQSTWLISTSESAAQLWDRMATHVDSNDSVLIIRVTAEWAGWLTEEAWQWIRDHVHEEARRF